MPVIEGGADTALGYGFSTSGDKLFLRVRYTDIPTSNPNSADFDGDGISNWDEVRIGGTGTDPFAWDTDGDGKSDYFGDLAGNGVADGWEIKHFSAIGIVDPFADLDQDGINNLRESHLDTDPDKHADTNDEDEDGLVDSIDAVPDDPLINWPATPTKSYFYHELPSIDGMQDLAVVAIGEGGHVLIKTWPTGSIKNSVNMRNYVLMPSTGLWAGPLSKVYNGTTGANLSAEAISSTGEIVGTAWVVDLYESGQPKAGYMAKCVWSSVSASPQPVAGTRLAQVGESLASHADRAVLVPRYAPDGKLLSMDHGVIEYGTSPAAKVKLDGADLAEWWDPLEVYPDYSAKNHFGQPGAGALVPMTNKEIYYNEAAEELDFRTVATYVYENGVQEQVAYGESAGDLLAASRMPDSGGVAGAGRIATTGNYTWIRKDGVWKKTKRVISGRRISADGIILNETTDITKQVWVNGEHRILESLCPSLLDENYTFSSVPEMNEKGTMLIRSSKNGKQPIGLMTPIEVVSRDRMLAGSIRIPEGWEDRLKIEFVHSGTDENLGEYEHLLNKDLGAYLHDSAQDIYNEDEIQDYNSGTLDPRLTSEKVVFCKRPGEDRVVEFYTAFANVGEIEIKLYLDGVEKGKTRHLLTQDSSFGGLINYINMLVTETPFEKPAWEAGASTVSTQQGDPVSISPATLRPMIEIFNGLSIGLEVDAESIIYGLCDGVVQGLIDDWELVKLLGHLGHAAVLHITDQVAPALAAEILRWHNDSAKRSIEVAYMLRRVVKHGFYEPMKKMVSELQDAAAKWADSFTSLEKFKSFNWMLLQRAKDGAMGAWDIKKDMDKAVFEAMTGWLEDFGQRMLDGGEKTLFLAEPWGGINQWRADIRAGYYTLGYVFGYVAEQVLLGKGIAAMGKGMGKLGGQIALAAIPHVKRFGAKLMPLLAKFFSAKKFGAASADEAVDIIKSTGKAMRHETGKTVGNIPITETVHKWMELQNAAKFNGKELLEEIIKAPRIRTLMRTPAFRHMFKDRLAKLVAVLGTDLSEDAMKGFIRAYDRLIKTADGTNFTDRFDDFLALSKAEQSQAGKTALKKSLEAYKLATDTNPNAKFWFKDVDKVQSSGYRYSSFDPRFDKNGNLIPGNPILKSSDAPQGGWYVTFEDYATSQIAKSNLQLPASSIAKYKLKFDFSGVKDKTRYVRGEIHASEIFEPKARDFPVNGTGGGTQLSVDGINIPIKEIWDVSVSPPIRIF